MDGPFAAGASSELLLPCSRQRAVGGRYCVVVELDHARAGSTCGNLDWRQAWLHLARMHGCRVGLGHRFPCRLPDDQRLLATDRMRVRNPCRYDSDAKKTYDETGRVLGSRGRGHSPRQSRAWTELGVCHGLAIAVPENAVDCCCRGCTSSYAMDRSVRDRPRLFCPCQVQCTL